jgi:hypothetical protein
MLRCLIAPVCLAFAGCVYLPYCLPEVDHVDSVRVPSPSADVRIFRVDGRETSWHGGAIGDSPGMALDESHELVPLTAPDEQMIAPQWAVSVETGSLAAFLPFAWSRAATKHTLALRFYRAGYETIEIRPGSEQKEFGWKAVADAAGLEKAVDDLIVDFETGGGLVKSHTSCKPVSGAKSSYGHRQTLRFCADEYDRIRSVVIGIDQDSVTMRNRLIDKANQLRELADAK